MTVTIEGTVQYAYSTDSTVTAGTAFNEVFKINTNAAGFSGAPGEAGYPGFYLTATMGDYTVTDSTPGMSIFSPPPSSGFYGYTISSSYTAANGGETQVGLEGSSSAIAPSTALSSLHAQPFADFNADHGFTFYIFKPGTTTEEASVSGVVNSFVVTVPEPSAWCMMLGGLALLGLFARRKLALVS